MRDQRETNEKLDNAQQALFNVEHSGAWLMAAAALLLGLIGLLVGFNVLDFRSGEVGLTAGGETVVPGNFLDGAMLLFAGMTAAVLAFTLHASDHHRGSVSSMTEQDRATSAFEHSMAYVMAIASIALPAIGLLVGYGLFDVNEPQLNALLWIGAGFGSSLLTATLHTVRHHQAMETDTIVAIVADRVRTGGTIVTAEPRTQENRTTR